METKTNNSIINIIDEEIECYDRLMAALTGESIADTILESLRYALDMLKNPEKYGDDMLQQIAAAQDIDSDLKQYNVIAKAVGWTVYPSMSELVEGISEEQLRLWTLLRFPVDTPDEVRDGTRIAVNDSRYYPLWKELSSKILEHRSDVA